MQKSLVAMGIAANLTSLSCAVRNQMNAGSETATVVSKPTSAALGPLPLASNTIQALSAFSQTSSLAKEYAATQSAFKEVYGTELNPYNLSVVRSSRFISRNGWDKNKEATDYNPIIMTDKYVLEKEQETGQPKYCRRADFSGRAVNVWESFDRAAAYVDLLTKSASNSSSLTWYNGYLRAPVPSRYYAESGRVPANASNTFDLDILLSLHVAGGEGATQDKSSCGRIGQIKSCDVMPYSPFYKPFLAATPCKSAGSWTPNLTEWQAMLSPEMRALGQTAIPLPPNALMANFAPSELGGTLTCSSPEGKNKERQWRDPSDPAQNGWAENRKNFPDYSVRSLAQGASFIANGTAAGQLGAFAVYASVQQTYKDLVNMKLKTGVLVKHPACEPCGLVRDASGKLVFDVFDRQKQGKGFCPFTYDRNKAFDASGTPKLDANGTPYSCIQSAYLERFQKPRSDSDSVRDLFEVDISDANHPAVTSVLTKHFVELKSGKLSQDPIERAAWIQQKTVAMHPFIDGDGRLSRFLMESTLHGAGLPFPMLTDFWADTQTSSAGYANLVREGVERQIGAIKACTAFAKCAAQNTGLGTLPGSGALAVKNICQSSSKSAPAQCVDTLSFGYGSGQRDQLKPCDCNALWDDNPKTVKWAACP
jgi:hypothetical protein